MRRRIPTAQPIWTYVLLAVNLLVFILIESSGGSLRPQNLIRFGANYAPLVDQGQYYRLVTANFIHIGAMHFFVNAYSLYVTGPLVEGLFGHARFMMLYLLSGIAGAVGSYLFTHGLSAGASTALFGMLAALLVYFYRQKDTMKETARYYLRQLLITLAINVAYGIFNANTIDNFGHLGGFIGGAVLGWFFCPRYEISPNSFGVINPRKLDFEPELDNGELMDTNTMVKQWPVVLAMVIVLAALVYARGHLV